MDLFRNILVAVDIDANGDIAFGCRAAVAQSLWVAQRNGARLSFVHVNAMDDDMRGIVDMQPQSPLTLHLARSRRLVESLAATVPDGAGTARLLHGNAAQRILGEVERAEHDLVVVGTRERSQAGRALFGSTAEALLRACPCPVWAVKPQQQAGFSRVLVAHDFGAGGEAALQLGASLALRQDAELHVLHVVEEGSHALPHAAGEQERAKLARRLMDACHRVHADARAFVAVRNGEAPEQILDYATAQAIDLLCMGTQGRQGLARLMIGNTAEKVLPGLCCSLLAVRPEGLRSAHLPAARSVSESN